jgi:hypothetical protein
VDNGGNVQGRWVLHLSPGGEYKVEEHKELSDVSYAISAVMTYRWKIRNKMDYDIKANNEMYNF